MPTGYDFVLRDQNGWSRSLHFKSAWILVFGGLLYTISGLFTAHFRKRLLLDGSALKWASLSKVIANHLRFRPPRRPRGVPMSNFSRRKLITGGLAATTGASGLAVAARLADRHGLIPPALDSVYGLGESLTYASQRLLTSHSPAREFPRSQISKTPFANGKPLATEDFLRLQADSLTASEASSGARYSWYAGI